MLPRFATEKENRTDNGLYKTVQLMIMEKKALVLSTDSVCESVLLRGMRKQVKKENPSKNNTRWRGKGGRMEEEEKAEKGAKIKKPGANTASTETAR